MRRSTVYWLIAYAALLLAFGIQRWELHTLRADLAYRTAAWEKCNVELEGGRD